MITTKEKAKELIEVFFDALTVKDCALVSVNNEIASLRFLSLLCPFDNYMKDILNSKIEELKEIKQEIEKL